MCGNSDAIALLGATTHTHLLLMQNYHLIMCSYTNDVTFERAVCFYGIFGGVTVETRAVGTNCGSLIKIKQYLKVLLVDC